MSLISAAGDTVTVPCSVHASTGLGECASGVPGSWFSLSAATTAVARVSMAYSGVTVLTREAGNVNLFRTPPRVTLMNYGMVMTLPESPRFPGDQFDVHATAGLPGATFGLAAWTVILTYSSAVVQLSSFQVDGIWTEPTTSSRVSATAGELRVLVNSPSNADVSNPLVRGTSIPILTARFEVRDGVQPGAYSNAVSLRIVSMVNFGNNMIVENADALVQDGGSSANSLSSVLDIEAEAEVGLFAVPR